MDAEGKCAMNRQNRNEGVGRSAVWRWEAPQPLGTWVGMNCHRRGRLDGRFCQMLVKIRQAGCNPWVAVRPGGICRETWLVLVMKQ
jgi:hypothetical protein